MALMGAPAGERCEVCGGHKADVVERDVPLRTKVCDACWTEANTEPPAPNEREPERIDADGFLDQLRDPWSPRPDEREGPPAICSRCGADASWHKTVNGNWVLMELEPFPTRLIAPGHRWRIGGDGTAINLGRANPSDTVRVSHFDACPANHPPRHSSPLLALWKQRRTRHPGSTRR